MDPAIISIGHQIPGVATTANDIQIQELLEPYTKEELVSLLADTAAKDSHFHSRINHLLRHDKKWCKLFVHGLSYQTTNATLHDFYSQFGQLKEAVVLMDKKGQSKGYGFVTYINREGALSATKVDRHKIDNRMTHCCLAFYGNPRKMDNGSNSGVGSTGGSDHEPKSPKGMGGDFLSTTTSQTNSSIASTLHSVKSSGGPKTPTSIVNNADPSRSERRLFVHSLAWRTDDDTLRSAFEQYGEIEEAIVIRDKKTQKSKGYGFVVFMSADSAQRALAVPEKMIDNRQTKCNLACERTSAPQPPVPTHPVFQPEYVPHQMSSHPPPQMGGAPGLQHGGMPNPGIGGMPFVGHSNGVGSIHPSLLPQNSNGSNPPSLPSLSNLSSGQFPILMNSFGGFNPGSMSLSSAGQPFSPGGFPHHPRAPSSISSLNGGVPPNLMMPYGHFPPMPTVPTVSATGRTRIVAVPNKPTRMQAPSAPAPPQSRGDKHFDKARVGKGHSNGISRVEIEDDRDEIASDGSSPMTQRGMSPETDIDDMR